MNQIQPILLGVNVDHVATLRQARGTDYPDPLEAAFLAQAGGADGITVHLREDRRHIQEHDVERLKSAIDLPLNLEMAAVAEVREIALRILPAECCLVPERREELTTEGGLEVAGRVAGLREFCGPLREAGIKVSLFIDPEPEQVAASAEVGATIIELHTGRYAEAQDEGARGSELERLRDAMEQGVAAGLQVNAGHGLHYQNVGPIAALPALVCLNIGHSIVSRAVFDGLQTAVAEMKRAMTQARQPD